MIDTDNPPMSREEIVKIFGDPKRQQTTQTPFELVVSHSASWPAIDAIRIVSGEDDPKILTVVDRDGTLIDKYEIFKDGASHHLEGHKLVEIAKLHSRLEARYAVRYEPEKRKKQKSKYTRKHNRRKRS